MHNKQGQKMIIAKLKMRKRAIIMIKEETKVVGEGVRFERIRRITGYLVGTLDRFNDAKAAEVRDRVKHDKVYKPCEICN